MVKFKDKRLYKNITRRETQIEVTNSIYIKEKNSIKKFNDKCKFFIKSTISRYSNMVYLMPHIQQTRRQAKIYDQNATYSLLGRK